MSPNDAIASVSYRAWGFLGFGSTVTNGLAYSYCMKTSWVTVLAACAGMSPWAMARDDDAKTDSTQTSVTNSQTGIAQPAIGSSLAIDDAPTSQSDPLAEQLAVVRPSLRLTTGSDAAACSAASNDAMKKSSQTRAQNEKQLRTIRRKHFGLGKGTASRQEGLAKLLEIAEPAMYPLFIEVFGRDDLETKTTVMGLFEQAASPEGDAALTWMAVFDRDAAAREEALQRAIKRKAKWPVTATPRAVQLVAFEALGSRDAATVTRAGNVVDALNIVEALPWMIAGQARSTSSGGATERTGALAWIVVGTQTNYVSDLEPVVSEGAVAFDPEISTFTSGTFIRVLDAVVVTYNLELHNALTRFSRRLTNADTDHLGWNYAAWKRWHENEFKPLWAAKVQTELDKQAGGASEEVSPLAMEAVAWPESRVVK